MNQPQHIRFAFFGSSRFSILVLNDFERAGYIPVCVVTTPDKPQGRKLVITPNVVKTWAVERNIAVYDPAKLDEEFIEKLKKEVCDVFIVASYGKIIPALIIDLPRRKTLNIHPSLLPKYRGASPLQSAILDDAKATGVT
ncbi:MAG: methionyl-tRNA formyltransferase, partial [bacterium]|nr:methionyl-tRNA formyltransferase [bacterium]